MALKNSVLNKTDYLLRVGYVAIVFHFFKVVAFEMADGAQDW